MEKESEDLLTVRSSFMGVDSSAMKYVSSYLLSFY